MLTMNDIKKTIHQELLNAVSVSLEHQKRFFKTASGCYSEHDKFMGVTVPNVRKIAKKFSNLTLQELEQIITSEFNEARFLALVILVSQYKISDLQIQKTIYQFYLNNMQHVNNWNLVDASAHLIVGAYLFDKDKKILHELALSTNLWQRRIAIVATWFFIKNNLLLPTLEIAQLLLTDEQDLIHKATGWMLREVGKKDTKILVGFLTKHGNNMPRTALRYAIEKFPEEQRKRYLNEFKSNGEK